MGRGGRKIWAARHFCAGSLENKKSDSIAAELKVEVVKFAWNKGRGSARSRTCRRVGAGRGRECINRGTRRGGVQQRRTARGRIEGGDTARITARCHGLDNLGAE